MLCAVAQKSPDSDLCLLRLWSSSSSQLVPKDCFSLSQTPNVHIPFLCWSLCCFTFSEPLQSSDSLGKLSSSPYCLDLLVAKSSACSQFLISGNFTSSLASTCFSSSSVLEPPFDVNSELPPGHLLVFPVFFLFTRLTLSIYVILQENNQIICKCNCKWTCVQSVLSKAGETSLGSRDLESEFNIQPPPWLQQQFPER
jgi:hypothetical protein